MHRALEESVVLDVYSAFKPKHRLLKKGWFGSQKKKIEMTQYMIILSHNISWSICPLCTTGVGGLTLVTVLDINKVLIVWYN